MSFFINSWHSYIIVDGRVHFGHEAGSDELTETNQKGRPVTTQ